MDHVELEPHLTRVEQALAALEAERGAARYARALGRPAADDAGLDAREAALWGDADYQGALQRAAAAGVTGEALARSASPAGRRLDLHRRALLEALVRLDERVAPRARAATAALEAFRPWLGEAPATRVEREERLRREPDRDAREALWFSLAPLAEAVEADLVRLLEARNAAARAFGFSMFPDLAFEAAELSRIEFMATCDELEQLTRPAYEEFLAFCRRQLEGVPLEPWDLDFCLALIEPDPGRWPREAVRLEATRLLAGWGAALDPAALPDEAPAMNPAGLTVAVDTPDDVRVLLGGGAGRIPLEAALREMGHALHRRHLPADAPAWRMESGVAEQAMGQLAVRLSLTALEETEADDRSRAWRRWRDVARLRRRISEGLFEMLAYEQPTADLHGLYSEIQEHYLGYSRHPERLWATVPSFVARPFHLPDLITGLLMADQIAEALRAGRDGTPGDPGIAARVREALWAPGARLPWETRLMTLTGRGLDAGATLRRLGVDADL